MLLPQNLKWVWVGRGKGSNAERDYEEEAVRSFVRGSSLNLATAKDKKTEVRVKTEKEGQKGLQDQIIAITLQS
jgi:hypothetical protein